jgi:excisionase family DNA binding protein
MGRRETLGPMTMLTMRETAAYLRLGSTKTWQLAASGELPVVRLGRRVLVTRDDLDDYIRAHREGGSNSAPTGRTPVRAPRGARKSGRTSLTA